MSTPDQRIAARSREWFTDIVVVGEPDPEATQAWLRARPGRRPRRGSTRVSAIEGTHTWVDCDACGSAYALKAVITDDAAGAAGLVLWTTACHTCGAQILLREYDLGAELRGDGTIDMPAGWPLVA